MWVLVLGRLLCLSYMHEWIFAVSLSYYSVGGTMICSSGPSSSFSLFGWVRCLRFLLVLGWMMLCISLQVLCKPQGTEGRAAPTPPRKESLSGVEWSDKLLKGGWFFLLFLLSLFLFTSSIKHWSPAFLLAPLCPLSIFLSTSVSHFACFSYLSPVHTIFPPVLPLCLPGWEGECGQHGSGGADMPAFHHPAMTEEEFHALSI